jgi:glycosyltransferase involved in cell wall biosynthesis
MENKHQDNRPLVSCLMVTRPSARRLPLVQRSIDCYLRQSYPSSELVIVLDAALAADRRALEGHVAGLRRTDVRVVQAPGQPTLGQLRNFAMDQAQGELVCVWDDDDIHHPQRLELQVRALQESGAIATFLSEVLHLFAATGELYSTNYRKTVQKCLPGTGLVRRDVASRYPESGPDCQRGEDTAFCLRLLEEGPVHFADDAPQLYVYVNHHTNTSGDAHHRMLARELGVSRGRVLRREAQVREALDQADFDLDFVDVMGNNGVAFTWARAGAMAAAA